VSDRARGTRSAGDHFSAVSRDYARFRPGYPEELIAWVAAQSPYRRRAWDCGAGNGQAARALAGHFERVVASDLSARQLADAPPDERVLRVAARAEAAPLAARSCDAVVAAQALHWFDLPAFVAEARRVLVEDGLLAAWSYGLPALDAPALDAIVLAFYHGVLGPYWPAERRLVDDGYRDIRLPQPELAPPPFHMERSWTLDELVGYVGTWSAVGAYRSATGDDPVPAFAAELADAWGDTERARAVRWPLVVRASRPGIASPRERR
jgi:SAM-dependent methyltransferase